MDEFRSWIATFDDGSQVLIEEWVDEHGKVTSATVAIRRRQFDTWGPPTELEEVD